MKVSYDEQRIKRSDTRRDPFTLPLAANDVRRSGGWAGRRMAETAAGGSWRYSRAVAEAQRESAWSVPRFPKSPPVAAPYVLQQIYSSHNIKFPRPVHPEHAL
ncbi:hypothetical protein ISCGN_004134 [Ixodes scapularis]